MQALRIKRISPKFVSRNLSPHTNDEHTAE
jgi:hypothetical protein